MQTNIKKIFQIAEKKNIAIGHFNVSNLETFEAVVRAGKKAGKPVVIGVSEGAAAHAGIDFFVWAKKYFLKKYKSDFYLHLDHGKNLDLIKEAINKGFDSVMIDASHENFRRNVYLTKMVVKWAHRKGVWVEAELGTIGGAEENIKTRKIIFTNPLQAREFVKKTKCDLLAIAIGTSHGPNKFLKKSQLNFEILKKTKLLVDVPLVLHGASEINPGIIKELKRHGVKIGHSVGVSESDLRQAVKIGIRKINIDTDLNIIGIAEFIKIAKNKNQELKMYKILKKVMTVIEEEVIRKIRLFSGK